MTISHTVRKPTIYHRTIIGDCCIEKTGGFIGISDDTDVFVLLLHYYHAQRLLFPVIMESPEKCRTVLMVTATIGGIKSMGTCL